jgi:hypothetical protein
MKPKNFRKKLSLNKTTVAALNTGAMNGVRGGATGYSDCPCIPTIYDCTITCDCPTINDCTETCNTCAETCNCTKTCPTHYCTNESICVTWPCAYCFN